MLADSRGAAADRIFAQMIEALQAVEYELPSFDAEPREVQLVDAARSRVQVRLCVALPMLPTS
jgi:hypothetical protein